MSVQLQWLEACDMPASGVEKGALAWCGCGWRYFTDRKDSTQEMLDRHLVECPAHVEATAAALLDDVRGQR